MNDKRSLYVHRLGPACLLAAVLVAAGCADRQGGSIPYNVANFGPPDSVSGGVISEDYKIAPLDVLTVRVFGMPDLSGDYRVDLFGNISLPLIGDVTAFNLTPSELSAVLKDKYGAKYLENPDISIGVKSAAGHIVTVDGAVERAGVFPVTGTMTLMRAIALAGGVKEETANMHRVAIFRTIDGQRQAAAFDLVRIQHGEIEDPAVYSGDIVVVDGSAIKDFQRRLFEAVPLFGVFRPLVQNP